jgi:hypothetical protein
MVMSVKEWRLRRDQAGILIGYVIHAPKGKREKAWEIYSKWNNGIISFREAERQLMALTGLVRP